ncbi:hypothetical protein HUJ04_011094 [Dendroctonus ponderosae]|nr:hypothetical protein HUJ04_011094 [Dendroctonus ponderosae]
MICIKKIVPKKLKYYYQIFNAKFNLYFKSPHQDSCKLCDKLPLQIKAANEENRKQKLLYQRELHQRKAEAARKIPKNDSERVGEATLTGVAKGYSDEELLRTINEENPEIKTNFGDEMAQKLKVVHRKDCINARKENILMEADPDIFRYLVKKEIVFIDWVPYLDTQRRSAARPHSATSAASHTNEDNADKNTRTAPTASQQASSQRIGNTPPGTENARSTGERNCSISKR